MSKATSEGKWSDGDDDDGRIETKFGGLHLSDRRGMAESKDRDESHPRSHGALDEIDSDVKGSGNEGSSPSSSSMPFRINWMNMKDALTGRKIWVSSPREWNVSMFEREILENVPKEILRCKAVSREINFTSQKAIESFRIEQRVCLHGQCIERWSFVFGFVMPSSTNTWQQVIEAAPSDKMLPAEVLSGNVTFETLFFDGDCLMCTNVVRIAYV